MANSEAVDLSSEQLAVVECIHDWYEGAGLWDMTVGGLAGTGKTTIAQQLPALLDVPDARVAYCAYTGKAASVLNRRLGAGVAKTIHRLIYDTYDSHCADCPRAKDDTARCHSFMCERCKVMSVRKKELEPMPSLVIVDEASMVSEQIYNDLTAFGVPVVWLGDHGQLPPIASAFNLMDEPVVKLEKIHRQAEGSAILRLSRMARNTGSVRYGEYGPGVRKRRQDGTLVVPDAPWDDSLMVLCGRNSTRTRLNATVRELMDVPAGGAPVVGDRVICLRNNMNAGIFNGMTGNVLSVSSAALLGGLVLKVKLDGTDAVYEGCVAREQFGSQRTLTDMPRAYDLWDFGYCMTVHKAQGSEAERVILLEERMGSLSNYKRWLYTGITRAKSQLEIIA